MTERKIVIRGMSCGHCVMALRRELAKLPGLQVNDVAIGSASVVFDERDLSLERIHKAIREAGYAPGE